MRRRLFLLGLIALGSASATGCANRLMLQRPCCGGSIFPGRRPLLQPVEAPIHAAPIGYGAHEGAPAGFGAPPAPGCSSCAGGGGPPIATSVGYPQHALAANQFAPPVYSGSGVPLDSMLLPSPTVIPPGAGTPRIVVDPPKPMPK